MTRQLRAPVLGVRDGQVMPSVGHVTNRYMIDGAETGGRLTLLQHLFEPNALAAPMHRHHDEDEYSFVLAGRIGAILDGDEVIGGPGDLIFKPRGQWHTFWNAGDEPATVLELISPGGLENLFKSFGSLTGQPDPGQLAEMAAEFQIDIDMEATAPVIQRHGLVF